MFRYLLLLFAFPRLVFGCLPTEPYDNTALSGPLFPSSGPSPSLPQPSSPIISSPAESTNKLTGPLLEVVITPSPPGTRENIAETVDSPCPPSWVKFSSTAGYKKCYQQIMGDFDYLGAKYDCQSRGASIVTIENAEEYVFLKAMCTTGRTLYLEAVPYIGLVRDDVIGHLKWEDGNSGGFLKFFKEIEPAKEDGNCFKFVTDQTIADGNLLHDGLAGYYAASDCLHMSRSALCQIVL